MVVQQRVMPVGQMVTARVPEGTINLAADKIAGMLTSGKNIQVQRFTGQYRSLISADKKFYSTGKHSSAPLLDRYSPLSGRIITVRTSANKIRDAKYIPVSLNENSLNAGGALNLKVNKSPSLIVSKGRVSEIVSLDAEIQSRFEDIDFSLPSVPSLLSEDSCSQYTTTASNASSEKRRARYTDSEKKMQSIEDDFDFSLLPAPPLLNDDSCSEDDLYLPSARSLSGYADSEMKIQSIAEDTDLGLTPAYPPLSASSYSLSSSCASDEISECWLPGSFSPTVAFEKSTLKKRVSFADDLAQVKSGKISIRGN